MKKILFLAFFTNMLLTNVLFANAITLTSGVEESGHVDKGAEKHYKIEMTEGQSLNSVLNELTADNDLYVKLGSVARKHNFDCKSVKGNTQTDSCSLTTQHDVTAYITVMGYKAADYSLTATLSGGNDDGDDMITLSSGHAVSGSVDKDAEKHYKIEIAEGQSLNAVLNELTADNDLYVKLGSVAGKHNFDCKSVKGNTQTDSCSITAQHNTTAYITVIGYKAAHYSLTATLNGAGNDGLNISDSVTLKETKFYTIAAEAGQTVHTVLDRLNADADLYVRVGAEPTGDLYDCRPYKGGTTRESCSVTVSENTTVHIAVYGAKGTTSFTLTAKATNGGGENTPILLSGESVSGSVNKDAIKYYKIAGQSGKKITATISELSADADLYVKKGSKPTAGSFDCKSTHGGTNSDTCSLDLASNEEIYIGVLGFRTANYNLVATLSGGGVPLIPANPEVPTVLEDAEGGTLNPNWITLRGDKPGEIFPTPDIPGAPSGTGVMVHHANGEGNSRFRYVLPLNITSQRVLSMDCGGLPTHKFENDPESLRGYIVHHSVGVIVDTTLGERFMDFDSWYNHQGYGPRKDDSGYNTFLMYPTPVEMVRGFFDVSTSAWKHFEVNLDDELHLLEPNNNIIRIKQFYTTGGFLDNITLSQAD